MPNLTLDAYYTVSLSGRELRLVTLALGGRLEHQPDVRSARQLARDFLRLKVEEANKLRSAAERVYLSAGGSFAPRPGYQTPVLVPDPDPAETA